MPIHPAYEELKKRCHTHDDRTSTDQEFEMALQECEDRYGRLSKSLQVVLYAAFPDKLTSRFFVSRQVERLTGYSAIQFQKEAGFFSHLVHPQDRDRVAQETLAAIKGQTRLDLEYRIITRDEQIRWIRDKASPVTDGDCTKRFEGFMEDITDSKDSASAIKEASNMWQVTFNAMSESLAILDKDCRIVQSNKALRTLVGKTEEQIVGRPCWEVIHEKSGRITNCPCAQVRGSRIRQTALIDIGERRFEVAIDPQIGENGEVTGYIHIMSDITEREKTDRALREARQTFITILDSIDATIYVSDMDNYEILFMNRHMRETFGGDFTGQRCWRAFRNQDGPCMDCTNDKLIDNQGQPTGVCVWEARNEITHRWHLNYDRAIRWIDGRFVHLQVATDITQLKRLEQERHRTEAQLRQAQKMEAIGTLAGGIAHDFNNILSAILGYSELALDDALNERASVPYIRQIIKAGARARDLVQQILTFSRQTETEAKPIQVKPIVKEALKLLRASLPSTIEIQPIIRSEAIVEADPIQIHQVIMNLCTNAGHAMRETGGTLMVTLADETLEGSFTDHFREMSPGEHLLIEVRDTGPGIAPEHMDKIFDPYFTTKEKGEGTGMGLAVVQGIVQGCNGCVLVETPEDGGVSFKIYLPIIHTDEPSQAKLDVVVHGGTERILFVDDEPPLAELTKQLLERFGYQVTIRTSSIEALNLFRSQPEDFDLVITDMTMPHMTGDQLALELMHIRPELPVMICTGYSEKITKELLERLHIKALILKPIIRNELLISIRSILDKDEKDPGDWT
ncbi:MAG: PAS domain-containing protein [Desulfobacteraceae bacterium]